MVGCNGMRIAKGWLLSLLFSVGFVSAADVSPLYFSDLGASPSVNPVQQQEYWDYLMKFKAWGTKGIAFEGMNIKMPDSSGWFGTADGDFTAANDQHVVGGPIVIGGSIVLGTGTDQFTSGPVRVSGNFDAGPNAINTFKGIYCLSGAANDNAKNGIINGNGRLYENGADPTGVCATDSVPEVLTALTVPLISDAGVTYEPALSADNSTIYIDVPPGDADSVYDLYLQGISFTNDSRLIVRMPDGGRLTRVFLNTNITFGKGSKIQIQYVDAAAVYNYTTKTYTTVNSYSVVQNTDYAGNLLFYMKGDMAWPAFSQTDTIQGSYISAGTMSLQQQMTLAGQLIATNLSINANFDGSGFRYVPFDPPILNFDPTALASGSFVENDSNAAVPITLDTLAGTNVYFNYCFEVSSTSATGLAMAADFNAITASMPLCGVDTGLVTILEGTKTPLSAVFVNAKVDTEIEPNETFKLWVFNLSGAVLSGNRRSGYFTLTVRDGGANVPPVLHDTTLSIPENSAVNTVAGTVVATDANGGTLTYSLNGTSALFALSSAGVVTVKTATLDYEVDSVYTISVIVSDGSLMDTATVTIKVTNANDSPVVDDATLNIAENSAAGTVVGTVTGTDPDGDVLTYSITGGTGKTFFAINASTGVVTVASGASLDYETESSYTLNVRVVDPSGMADTAIITVQLTNANDPPVLNDATLTVAENSVAGTVAGTVTAADPDGDVLTYSVTGGTGKNLFTINAVSGTITVTSGATLNYEAQSSYTLVVQAADGAGGVVSKTYTVTLTDVNETPVITSEKFTVSESVAAGSAIGTVKYTDPDSDEVTYALLADVSGKFEITSAGSLKLITGETLDYEEQDSYTVTVVVTDPGGLSDTADIIINVSNVRENSEVNITRAETTDSVWVNPDSIYINVTTLDIEWTEDGVLRFETVTLHEGENIIIKTYLDPTKDTPGVDTLIVFVNTKGPKVAVSVTTPEQNPVTGVTIVETKDAGDTATYINSESTKLWVTVVDSSKVGHVKDSFSVSLELDTVSIASSIFKTMESIQSTVILEEESRLGDDQKVTHTAVNGNTIAVSYTYTDTKGNEVTVTYYTDTEGTRILENGKAYFEVSYTYTNTEGKQVTLTYTTDAAGNAVTNTAGNVSYDISYTYTDVNKNTVTVTYSTDSKGNEVRDEDGNMIYQVSYTYTDGYGNTATQSVGIVLDVVLPVVRILSPEDQSTTSDVAIEVVWIVDGVEQDTLTVQGLKDGVNEIIRTYRDKAGNEGSDTVFVLLKNGKEVRVVVETPLVTMDPETLEKYYASNPSASEETYGVSFFNVKTGLEEEVAVGTASGTETGSFEEPYPGLSGTHLGPTLVVEAQIPAVNALGNSSTLADLVESDGLIALEAGGGWDREKVTVQEYVENYCSEDFANTVDLTNLGEASLYTNKFQMQIWVFTSIGQFVDEFSFSQMLDSQDYIDDGGMVKMYFEMKPDSKGYIRDANGRRYGTGVYIFKVNVKMVSVLQCQLPDSKVGSRRVVSDDILKSWGYSRPE